MAKKQTFTSKLGKDKKKFKVVKYIQTLLSEKTGHIKFLSRMIRMEEDENIDQALKREEEESSNVLAFGEQPEEEAQEEAPVEEPSEEAPVEEELKEEQPAEETPAEETQEEAPVEEETPTEEPAEEVSEEESAPEEDSAEKAEESSKE